MQIWLWETKVWLSECFHTRAPWCGEDAQLSAQEKSGLKNDFYSAGIFGDESHHRREKHSWFQKISTESTMTVERQVFPKFAHQLLVRGHTPVSLSSGLSAVFLLYGTWGSDQRSFRVAAPQILLGREAKTQRQEECHVAVTVKVGTLLQEPPEARKESPQEGLGIYTRSPDTAWPVQTCSSLSHEWINFYCLEVGSIDHWKKECFYSFKSLSFW